MKPTRSTVGLLALATALAAVPVVASADWGRNGAGPGAMFQNLNFAEIDTNADGGITLDEWRAFTTARIAERRASMIEARVAELFEGDANADGALSRDELTARIGTLADERRAERGEGRGEGRGWGRGDDDDRGYGRGWGRHHEGRYDRDSDRGCGRGDGPMGGGMGRGDGMGQGNGAGRGNGAGPGDGMGRGDPERRIVRSFQRIDTDGDARISQAELDAAITWMQERMGDRSERRGRDND